MKAFSQLFKDLDETNSANEKTDLIVRYLQSEVSDEDKLWTIALFLNRRPRRPVKTSLLRQWCAEISKIPYWLFEENYHIIGDFAETVSLVLPPAQFISDFSLNYWIEYIKALDKKDEEHQKQKVIQAWNQLDAMGRFLFSKMITGGFRVGVSEKIIVNAIAKVSNLDTSLIMMKLAGRWTVEDTTWENMITHDSALKDDSKPYPFYLGHPLELEAFGKNENIQELSKYWSAEWKWDGIRAQLIKRNGQIFIWSRGDELITDSFPEFLSVNEASEDFVLDGEIIVRKNGIVGDFADIQKRIGRKTITKKILEEFPCTFIMYDVLERSGEDLRQTTFQQRRVNLEQLFKDGLSSFQHILLSPTLLWNTFEELENLKNDARTYNAEGIMLKSLNGVYHAGRKKGEMWKWKLDPFTIDAVLLFAQRGHGRRSNLYSDFTFALWDDNQRLVTFAKAYSGLTDLEMKEITAFVKNNTIESFGPVSSVKPELVFEIAFEGIQISNRNKSGIAVRFPRIKCWRKDKNALEANTLEDIKKLF